MCELDHAAPGALEDLCAAAEQFDNMNAMLTRHGFQAGQAGIKDLLIRAGVELQLAPEAADMEAVPRGQV